MSKFKQIYKTFWKDPKILFKVLLAHSAPLFSDKTFLKLLYLLHTGNKLNLNNPTSFNEKLQWLKLYNRKPEYTKMVDKYEAKKYVASIIGEDYIIPTLGIYNTVEDIPWNELSEQFVLKCTHDSGGVVICNDKSSLDKKDAIKKLSKGLKRSFYPRTREWPYKNVVPRILCEEYKIDDVSGELKDYKFFCFDGEPKFLKVDFDRFIEHHANYYDMDWNFLPFGEADLPPVESHIEECPTNFEKMKEIARKLSAGQKFLRVDLYNINGKIYFGELTFYPASGLGRFTDSKWDTKLGALIHI